MKKEYKLIVCSFCGDIEKNTTGLSEAEVKKALENGNLAPTLTINVCSGCVDSPTRYDKGE
jgi:predicted metal-binding protein